MHNGLVAVGVKAAHRDHVDTGSQVALDQAGQQCQLPCKTVVLVSDLVLTAHISFVDQARILVGRIGDPPQEAELVPVHTIPEKRRVQTVLFAGFRDLLQLVHVRGYEGVIGFFALEHEVTILPDLDGGGRCRRVDQVVRVDIFKIPAHPARIEAGETGRRQVGVRVDVRPGKMRKALVFVTHAVDGLEGTFPPHRFQGLHIGRDPEFVRQF